MKLTKLLAALWLAALTACHTGHLVTRQTYQRIAVDSTATPDTRLVRLLTPYRQKLDQSMNVVLTRSAERLEKRKPECALNDLLCDALLAQSTERYGKPIDLAQLNYGGVRNGLPEGNITTGSIFEVMPFDNQLVVLTLTGDQLLQFLNHFAKGGSLLVSGIQVKIHDDQVQSVTFNNGRTLLPNETYAVALSDYIANGGDDAAFLKGITRRETLNYLIRDALIDYFRKQGRSGQPLTTQANGRITIE